jgi:hypothetical protein
MQNYSVIMRIEKETGLPLVFFPETLDQYGNLDCYAHLGQHSAASMHYYWQNTTSPKEKDSENVEALRRELTSIYSRADDPDAVNLVWKMRLTRKLS